MNYPATNNEPDNGYHSIPDQSNVDYLELIRKRYPLILLCVLLATGIAAFHFFSEVPLYQSSMEVLIGQRSTGLVANSGSGADVASDGVITRSDILATHLRILNSPMLLSRIHERVTPEDYPTIDRAELSKDMFVARVLGGLKFDYPDPAASVVKISYHDVNPVFAKEVLELLYLGYQEYVDTHTESTGSKAIKLITDALAQNESELRTATTEYQEYIATSPYLLEGDSLSDMQHGRLRETMQELSTVRGVIADVKSRLEIINDRLSADKGDLSDADRLALIGGNEDRLAMFLGLFNGGGTGGEDMTSEAVRGKYQELVEQNLRVELLQNQYGPDHPTIQSLRQSIAITEKFIRENTLGDFDEGSLQVLSPKELLESYQLLLENDLTLSTAREKELAKESEALLVSTKSVEGGYLKAAEMRSRIDRAQQRYEELSERLQDINLTSNIMGISSDMLSPPATAGKPFSPDPFKVFGIGGLLGLMVGMGLAYLAESLDRTFKDPNDLEASLGLPVVAHITTFTVKRKDRRVALDTGIGSHIRTFHDPQGIDAEGFRLLRTMLLLKAKNEQLQTIAITSANPSDGKSTILANLAVSIAKLDKRVLLIDGDMRRPTVKTTFNLTADAGLSDCLLGEVEASEATFPTAQDNLWIMPHGNSVPNPAELLQSMRMEWLLEQLKAHYDFVLIDLPPILAVTDPLVVAQQMDGFLMAARITKNGRKPVESAARRIQSTGAKMLGVVVNGAEKKTSSYGYSNYSESYRYGYVKEYHKQYEASRA